MLRMGDWFQKRQLGQTCRMPTGKAASEAAEAEVAAPGGQPSVSGCRAQTVGGAGSCEASEALVRSLLLVLIVTNVSLGSGVTHTDLSFH